MNRFTPGQKIYTEEAARARDGGASGGGANFWGSAARRAKRSPAKQGLLAALLRSARLPFVSRRREAKLDGSKQRNRSRPMRVPEKSFEPERTCPLDGVRVIDLSRLVSGNMVSLQLADFGAEVIKIEDPKRGDPLRFGSSILITSAPKSAS